MNNSKSALLACGLLLLTACSGEKQAPDTATPKAPEPPALTETPTVDPNAINEPIAAEAFKIQLSLNGTPRAATNGNGMEVEVTVANNGNTPVYGVGSKPVNLGVLILGDGDDVTGTGGVRDFVRQPLPLIAPGSSATVLIHVPADDRIDGRKLRISVVQEAVAWLDGVEQSRVDVGPFNVCGGQICTEAGTPLTP